MVQIPHGPENLICPLHRKAMAKVCHVCPMWIQVRGKDPQSNAEVDHWNCSLAWLPMLMIENSQMQRQTGAAVESFRNEVVRTATATKEITYARDYR
jgi:hypothetical protein